MVGRHDLALLVEVGQAGVEAAGAQRGHLGELERSEGAAVGDLDVVGDRLVAEHQERVGLEGLAHGLVGLGVGGDVEHGDAFDLDPELPGPSGTSSISFLLAVLVYGGFIARRRQAAIVRSRQTKR